MSFRFWTFINDGWVRISLQDGQTLHHHAGGPTDEGWWSRTQIWTCGDGKIIREVVDDGRDCDGRLTHYYTDACPITDLAKDESPLDPGIRIPRWLNTESSQRDEYAEMAGY